MRRLLLWASENPWMRDHIPQMKFVRKAVQRFIPGEDLESAMKAVGRFGAMGIPTVLTHLGENVFDREEAASVTRHYRNVLDVTRKAGCDAEISVKLTHLGLDLDPKETLENLLCLLEDAAEAGNYVWVDMEGSRYTDATLDLVERARAEHPNVGVCVQAYLRRTADDIERMASAGAGIRLVKGAYEEPPSIAFSRKAEVDENFLELSRRLLERAAGNGIRVGLGTHDAALIDRIRSESQAMEARQDFEFQMLYGIKSDLQVALKDQGFGVRVLISYGAAWYAWYMRRLAERPANILFALRSLVGR